MYRLIDILFFYCFITNCRLMQFDFNDYTQHPCIRDCSQSVSPMVCEYNWTIEWYTSLSKACYDCPFNLSDCSRPHCVTTNGITRLIMSVNRMVPGPAIQVCQDDEIVVNLYNGLRMSESTSIHWHGILQEGTPYMDGVAMITQCPIHPHTTFQYKFIAKNAGTHFWHSHSGIQRADGSFGAIIVRTKNDPHLKEYDEDAPEHVIVLNDWFLNTVSIKFAMHHHSNGSDKPETILINGKGSQEIYSNKEGEFFKTPRSIFKVQNGKRYRFRLIHSGISYCPIQFSIESHKFSVISSDGKSFKKIDNLEAVVLYPGERYDLILSANQPTKTYWIRAKGLGDCEDNKVIEQAYLVYNQSAIPSSLENDLPYDNVEIIGLQLNNHDAPEDTPKDKLIQLNQLSGIEPFEGYFETIKGKPNKKFYLGMEFKYVDNPEFNNEFYPIHFVSFDKRLFTPQINRISFSMPSSPALTQWNDLDLALICNEENRAKVCPPDTNTTYCSCIHTLEVSLGDLVELIVVDETLTKFPIDIETLHPMHLHGHFYSVVGLGQFDEDTVVTADLIRNLDKEGKIERNFNSPVLKDTSVVPDGGYAILRFIANNPGTWFFHCHLDFHSEIGMSLIIKVNDGEFKELPENWPQCGSFPSKRKSSDILSDTNSLNFNSLLLLSILILFI